MTYDVAIVGGNFAGLSAAYPLVRASRKVMLFDVAKPRNRYASESHGFLGQDGATPQAIRQKGLGELKQYPAFNFMEEKVINIKRLNHPNDKLSFELETSNGSYQALRIILATGMRDIFPDISGIEECWGKTVNQCPYCHGYELRNQPTGILHCGEASLHHAKILTDFSDDLLYFQNGHEIDTTAKKTLESMGVKFVKPKITKVNHKNGFMSSITLEDGVDVKRQALYLITKADFASRLPLELGCEVENSPFGSFLKVNASQETSQQGIYAAGDIARPMYGAVSAAADGSQAGASAHHSILADIFF